MASTIESYHLREFISAVQEQIIRIEISLKKPSVSQELFEKLKQLLEELKQKQNDCISELETIESKSSFWGKV
jgi:DNA repair exonuclease SbcCD ATPase subunit